MPTSKRRKLKRYPKVNTKEKVATTFVGRMSEPSKFILSLKEKKTSPNTIKIQESKIVPSAASLIWDSSRGTYTDEEKREMKREMAARKLSRKKKKT